MARWLSFFSEYNFVVHYKQVKANILADTLSRRLDYDHRSALNRQEVDHDEDDDRCAMGVSLNLTRVSPESCLFDEIVAAYNSDPDYADIIAYLRAPSDVALGSFIAIQARSHPAVYVGWRLAPIPHRSILFSSHCDCQ